MTALAVGVPLLFRRTWLFDFSTTFLGILLILLVLYFLGFTGGM
jgi:hypothetical protein